MGRIFGSPSCLRYTCKARCINALLMILPNLYLQCILRRGGNGVWLHLLREKNKDILHWCLMFFANSVKMSDKCSFSFAITFKLGVQFVSNRRAKMFIAKFLLVAIYDDQRWNLTAQRMFCKMSIPKFWDNICLPIYHFSELYSMPGSLCHRSRHLPLKAQMAEWGSNFGWIEFCPSFSPKDKLVEFRLFKIPSRIFVTF